MKLLLFGGTFDPPHYGHMSLLQHAVELVQPDEVVVMVAGVPPHKQSSTTPPALRLAMCACFYPLFPRLVVSDAEVRRAGKSYTYDTVKQLQKSYLGAQIFLCVGSDMLLGFTTWRCWRELLQEVSIVAQSRLGTDDVALRSEAAMLRQEGGRVLFTKAQARPLSSSEIRAAVGAGEDPLCLLPPPAGEIVCENRLYGMHR